jgi:ubiquinone biosynthesis protein COQ4
MTSPSSAESYKRDLPAALRAIRKLLANPGDTTQVFLIMRALNGPAVPNRYWRLLKTPGGAQQAYRRVELAQRLSDPEFVAGFVPGTVGAAYRAFLEDTGYSAAGLAEISNLNSEPMAENPYAWLSRRTRDVHDIWHVLTGYKADESLGEASLVAFSYAQAGGLGWGFIAAATVLKSIRVTGNFAFARSVWEGYRNGRRAMWLLAEDYENLLREPLERARQRLRIGHPAAYLAAQRRLGERWSIDSGELEKSANG